MKKTTELTVPELQVALFGTSDKRAIATAALVQKMLDSGDVSDHPYQRQFQAFFDAIEKDIQMPLTSLNDALITHKVIFAADASAHTGKPVQL